MKPLILLIHTSIRLLQLLLAQALEVAAKQNILPQRQDRQIWARHAWRHTRIESAFHVAMHMACAAQSIALNTARDSKSVEELRSWRVSFLHDIEPNGGGETSCCSVQRPTQGPKRTLASCYLQVAHLFWAEPKWTNPLLLQKIAVTLSHNGRVSCSLTV